MDSLQIDLQAAERGIAMPAPHRRIRGLDTIRIVCAFWVFAFHASGDLLGWMQAADGSIAIGHSFFRSLMSNMFAGPAAVIVFFVISGLVVHYTNVGGRLDLYAHYTRRFIRVGGPIVALWLLLPLLITHMTVNDLPVWSLWCELIYYALYPVLLWAIRRYSWRAVLAVLSIAALGLAVSPGSGNGAFAARGVTVTWILGLPIWLLGAWAAEHIHDKDMRRRLNSVPISIWWLRIGMAIGGSAATWMRFHTPLSEQISLVLYGLPAAAWVMAEINRADFKPPPAWLEAQGAWSYSLYLVHPIAIVLLIRYLPTIVLLKGSAGAWLMCIISGVCLALVFFKLVEQPCHRLARQISKLNPANLR